ncbi:hypothetical protein [Paramicrobacterium agarici]|uniref:hypothetical protein n=1 Tax=Paramicrobacterium agarici TaxID=630514 RepID=UPI001151CF29|nr:hypothetical protein [Microbacterium agarici]TQO24257.1 hypothetical protein FB385_3137 [Microbacterium agarici]
MTLFNIAFAASAALSVGMAPLAASTPTPEFPYACLSPKSSVNLYAAPDVWSSQLGTQAGDEVFSCGAIEDGEMPARPAVSTEGVRGFVPADRVLTWQLFASEDYAGSRTVHAERIGSGRTPAVYAGPDETTPVLAEPDEGAKLTVAELEALSPAEVEESGVMWWPTRHEDGSVTGWMPVLLEDSQPGFILMDFVSTPDEESQDTEASDPKSEPEGKDADSSAASESEDASIPPLGLVGGLLGAAGIGAAAWAFTANRRKQMEHSK